jgi:hypothetical protein
MKLIINLTKADLELCPQYIQGDIVLSRIVGAVKNGTPIPDNATVCDIEQIRDAIEREADYQDANVNADVAKGMYMAMEIIDKHRK